MSTNHLNNQEAIDKLKTMATAIDVAMMATDFHHKPLHVIPMSTKKVDDKGTIWFLSNRNSEHNAHIKERSEAQLIYGHPGTMQYLTVYGKATIHTDRQTVKDLYTSMDDTWFEGPNDPNCTAISIEPQEAYYWDTKSGKFVSMLKIGMGAITGNEPDLGEEGHLSI